MTFWGRIGGSEAASWIRAWEYLGFMSWLFSPQAQYQENVEWKSEEGRLRGWAIEAPKWTGIAAGSNGSVASEAKQPLSLGMDRRLYW